MNSSTKWSPLFITQFLGVLNDNLLKSLVCFVGVQWIAGDQTATVVALASAMMLLPYVLLSPLAGHLARVYPKVKIMRWAKLAEIPVMAIAATAFFIQSLPLVLIAVFFMGLQSALYAPSKMGLIRDIGQNSGLSFGNGMMELLAFGGALLGTLLAGWLGNPGEVGLIVIGCLLLLIALAGWIFSLTIFAREPEDTETETERRPIDPLRYLIQSFRWSNQIKGLNRCILGLGAFWMIASLIQLNLFVYLPRHLNYDSGQTALTIAFVALFTGFGAWVAGLVSRNRVEFGLTPIGGLGMAVCLFRLAFFPISESGFLLFISGGAFFAGMFKVPLNAWIQERVQGRKLGEILAYSNQIVFLSVLCSAAIFSLIDHHFGSMAVFQFTAVVAAATFVLTLLQIPAMLLRFIFLVLAHTVYRIRIKGGKHIPKQSGALIVANHLSFMDALLIVAAVPRMVRFVMNKSIYDHPLLNWFFKRMNMIPVSGNSSRESLEQFNATCREEINKGHVVCIFAEGQVSRNGNLLGFRKGIEHIAKGMDAPIIPLNMDNVVGGPFSFPVGRGKVVKLAASSLRKTVSISIGEALPSETPAFQVRQRVQELGAEAFSNRLKPHDHLGLAFLKRSYREGHRLFMADKHEHWSYEEARKAVIRLAFRWKEQLAHDSTVAVIGPKTARTNLLVLSLTCAGKTVIQLPQEQSVDCLETCNREFNVHTVILDGYQGTVPGEIRCLHANAIWEELEQRAPFWMRVVCQIMPSVWLHRWLTGTMHAKEELAAIIPRLDVAGGNHYLRLSHQNVLSHIESLKQIYNPGPAHVMLGILDRTSTYGFLIDTWLPALCGMCIALSEKHESPSELRLLMEKYEVTTLVANELFGEAQLSAIEGPAFSRLRYLIAPTGVLSNAYKNHLTARWELEIKESFGLTESTPIIAINSPDYVGKDIAGMEITQEGTKRNRVGRPIPGIAVRVVATSDFEQELPQNEAGMILIRGANVLRDYFNGFTYNLMSFHKGWYITGVIGAVDQEGFLSVQEG